jgi:hypothetical protein
MHYPPSYYRAHIHLVETGAPAADGVGRAHAVADVASAARRDPGRFRDGDITMVLGERHELAAAYGGGEGEGGAGEGGRLTPRPHA